MLKRIFKRRTAKLVHAVPAGRRVYVIGDIHGRLDLFDALLSLIETDNAARGAATVDLILLGDMVDRGPDSAGVVRRAMAIPAWVDRLVALRGNHEDAMLEAFDGDLEMARIWLRVGGRSSLESWGLDFAELRACSFDEVIAAGRDAIPSHELAWLYQLKVSHQIGDYYFVHAGIRPKIPLADQAMRDFLWIREDFLKSRVDHGLMIVHGHSISPDVEMLDNRIGIDTGAYITGRLTALCLEEADRWLLQTANGP